MGDRPSPLDLSNLRVERHGSPMHVAALALLGDGPRPTLDDVRRLVEERAPHAPWTTTALSWPHGPRRRPVWARGVELDSGHHVRAVPVPAPGGEAALLATAAELLPRPLDLTRPLWDLWLLTTPDGGAAALLMRLHHVVADGLAAVAQLGAFFDADPSAAAARPPPSVGVPAPGVVARAAATLRQTAAVARAGRAPVAPWNRPVGPRRSFALVRADLAAAKAAAHAGGGKVNDVVLAAVAGGARAWLERHDALAPDLELRVSVAVSVRRPGQTGGNRVGVRLTGLPVGEPDAARRLRRVVAASARQRLVPPSQPAGRLLQWWMVRVMPRQRMTNLVVSNVPGPTGRLSFAGAPVDDLFQLPSLQGNLGVGVGVLSYAGRLTFAVVADADLVPDVELFAGGVRDTLAGLGASGPGTAPATA